MSSIAYYGEINLNDFDPVKHKDPANRIGISGHCRTRRALYKFYDYKKILFMVSQVNLQHKINIKMVNIFTDKQHNEQQGETIIKLSIVRVTLINFA